MSLNRNEKEAVIAEVAAQAGKSQTGVLDADSARAARSQLRTQGLTPLVVEAAATRTRGS